MTPTIEKIRRINARAKSPDSTPSANVYMTRFNKSRKAAPLGATKWCSPQNSTLGYLGIWVLGCFLLCLSGCGQGTPPTYSVSGEVTYNGQPVEAAQVAFLTPGAARPAIAATDAQGKFTLRTFSQEDGAMEGEHRVTIVKQVPQGADADNPYPTFKNVLPAKYARPDTSGIVAVVSDERENVFRFDLVD